MKLTNVLKSMLLEKKGDSYDSGCIMLYFTFPQMKEIQSQIDEEDLYTEEGDRTYGLEDESHITLLFGVQDTAELDEVVDILDQFTYGKCLINNVSIFQNPKYDVLKFDVSGPNIIETNEALTENLPYKNNFPDYHPHLTIGYLQSGKGQRYVDMFEGKEYELMPRYAVYSEANGKMNKIVIKVNKN